MLHQSLAEDPAFLKRFRAEAHAAAALNHPNVMHVYDSGDAADGDVPVPYLVTEFLGGGSLRAVLNSGPAFSPSQALVVGLDVARGLEYAHERGFVHRDIKPANLLFGEEGRLRIADFGLARALAEASWTEPEGVLLGTARYSAPEQAMGRDVDGRSDVYSLALVLVEAVTGEVPFSRDTVQGTLLARTERDLEVPRSLGRLAPVLARAGRLDPEMRPDAGEMVIAFFAASEDMDRPKAISLPGAIPVEVLEGLVEEAERADSSDVPGSPDVPDEVVESRDGADGDEAFDDITLLAADALTEPVAVPVARVSSAASKPGVVAKPASIPAPSPTTEPASGATIVPKPEPKPEPASAEPGESDDAEHRLRWVLGVVVGLLLIGGGFAVWWTQIRTPNHPVPNLVGLSADAATSELNLLGLKVETSFVRKDGTDADEVVAQRPVEGTTLDEGMTVELDVSLGNTLVDPPLLDSSVDETTALARLDAAGLVVGARSEPFDETVPKGFVISAASTVEPDAAGQIPKGTPIDLVISAGPQPRTVPAGLVGQPIEAVTAALAQVQLGVHVTEEFSEEPVGTVLSMNTQDNAELPRDTVVEVTTSKGPELFPIPNVIGQTGSQATESLKQNGFPVAQVVGSPANKVVGVSPTVGEMRPKGTAVTLLTNG